MVGADGGLHPIAFKKNDMLDQELEFRKIGDFATVLLSHEKTF